MSVAGDFSPLSPLQLHLICSDKEFFAPPCLSSRAQASVQGVEEEAL